jgi:hypothetical protein
MDNLVGFDVGFLVGDRDGCLDGKRVGALVGALMGEAVGALTGEAVGALTGEAVGALGLGGLGVGRENPINPFELNALPKPFGRDGGEPDEPNVPLKIIDPENKLDKLNPKEKVVSFASKKLGGLAPVGEVA